MADEPTSVEPFVLWLDRCFVAIEQRLGPSSPALAALRAFRDDYAAGRTRSRAWSAVLFNGRLAGRIDPAEVTVFERELFGQMQALWPPCDLARVDLERLLERLRRRLGPNSIAVGHAARAITDHQPGRHTDDWLERADLPTHESTAVSELIEDPDRWCDPPPIPMRNRPLP